MPTRPPPPILRVLDAKKQVVGTHRSGKHNLQHPYAPKFPIFHEKNGKKWPLFGLKLSFSASDRQHENPPPYFEGAGCKKAGSRERQITKTQFIAYIFHEKTAKNGRFWSKIEFFGLRQAFEDPPPPISTVLDAKKQVLGRHRSRKHNLQHAYAPTFVIFHEKKRPRMAVFWSKIEFFGARQAFEDPPPHFEGAGCEKAGCKGTQTTKTQFAASVCTKTSHFS